MTSSTANPMKSLRHRAMAGGVWTMFGFGLGQAVRLISNLIMTRLLLPEAFGLMAIATAIYVWIGMMSDFGINASIIRSKASEHSNFLKTAFTLQVSRDGLIACVMGIVGIVIVILQTNGVTKEGTIYDDSRLSGFIWLICISIIITAFKSIKDPLAQREMNLKPLIGLEICGQVLGLLTMVLSVSLGAGVFSLAIGMIGSAIFRTAGSYLLLKGPPSRFGFKREHFNEIFNYGKWLLLGSFFGFIATKGNQVLFGFLFEKIIFSFFAIATIWITAAETIAATILQRIAFPAFSEIYREDKTRLANAYRSLRNIADIGCIVMFLGIFLFADFVFGILYSEEYTDVSYYLKLLSPLVLFLPYRLLNIILLAAGDSKRFTAISAAPAFALVILGPVIFHYFGEKGAVVFVGLLQIFSLPFTMMFSSRLITLNYFREAMPAVVAILAGVYLLSS